ncbi:hypothetical protein EDD86DRAFT_218343 [Gorgonomyces haynaldii]|nr:hypothetical protein EDD86DRAFT_218343 [Gorgonomyces haynaldii]
MLLNVWLNVVAQTTSQEVQSVEITQSPVSQLVTEQVAVTVSEQVASTVQVTVSEQVSVTSLQIAETAVLNATETQSNTTAIDTNGTITADATITQNTIVQNTIIYNSYSPTFDAMWQTERKPEETVTVCTLPKRHPQNYNLVKCVKQHSCTINISHHWAIHQSHSYNQCSTIDHQQCDTVDNHKLHRAANITDTNTSQTLSDSPIGLHYTLCHSFKRIFSIPDEFVRLEHGDS